MDVFEHVTRHFRLTGFVTQVLAPNNLFGVRFDNGHLHRGGTNIDTDDVLFVW